MRPVIQKKKQLKGRNILKQVLEESLYNQEYDKAGVAQW